MKNLLRYLPSQVHPNVFMLKPSLLHEYADSIAIDPPQDPKILGLFYQHAPLSTKVDLLRQAWRKHGYFDPLGFREDLANTIEDWAPKLKGEHFCWLRLKPDTLQAVEIIKANYHPGLSRSLLWFNQSVQSALWSDHSPAAKDIKDDISITAPMHLKTRSIEELIEFLTEQNHHLEHSQKQHLEALLQAATDYKVAIPKSCFPKLGKLSRRQHLKLFKHPSGAKFAGLLMPMGLKPFIRIIEIEPHNYPDIHPSANPQPSAQNLLQRIHQRILEDPTTPFALEEIAHDDFEEPTSHINARQNAPSKQTIYPDEIKQSQSVVAAAICHHRQFALLLSFTEENIYFEEIAAQIAREHQNRYVKELLDTMGAFTKPPPHLLIKIITNYLDNPNFKGSLLDQAVSYFPSFDLNYQEQAEFIITHPNCTTKAFEHFVWLSKTPLTPNMNPRFYHILWPTDIELPWGLIKQMWHSKKSLRVEMAKDPEFTYQEMLGKALPFSEHTLMFLAHPQLKRSDLMRLCHEIPYQLDNQDHETTTRIIHNLFYHPLATTKIKEIVLKALATS